MKKILLIVFFLISISALAQDIVEEKYEKYKQIIGKPHKRFEYMTRKELLEIVKDGIIIRDKFKGRGGSFFAFAMMEIIEGNKFTDDEKYEIVMDDIYQRCIIRPYKVRYYGYLTINENVSNFIERVKSELKGKGERIKNNCFKKQMVLALGSLKYGGKEIGDKLIDMMLNDPYGEFRYLAVKIFWEERYIDLYSKEYMLPILKKLVNDPYYEEVEEGRIGFDVFLKTYDPKNKKYCKVYPINYMMNMLLEYYKIKWEFDKSRCCNWDCATKMIEE